MKNVRLPFARCLVVAALAVAAQGSWAETITVSAAASLKDAFTELAQKYEANNPQDKVQLNFGGSGALFQQIEKGAPVDVFASADEKTMDKAEQAKLVLEGTRQTFVTNTLVLIRPAKGQAQLDSLQALQDKAVARIAIGNPESVPVGRYTKAALEAAQQWDALQPKLILAQNVRQALDYVARAEVDAGFVYGTDAALMKDKVKVAYVVPVEKTVSYPIAVMKTGAQEAAAKRFVALVTSPIGQGVLKSYGFVPAVK